MHFAHPSDRPGQKVGKSGAIFQNDFSREIAKKRESGGREKKKLSHFIACVNLLVVGSVMVMVAVVYRGESLCKGLKNIG